MTIDTISRWRVFCPRGGHEFVKPSETREAIRELIDRPCRRCGRLGVDAVELL
jgi:hypothetical protein